MPPLTPKQPLTGWGRYPAVPTHSIASEQLERASANAVLSRGLGRAYGDAALPPESADRPVVVTTAANRILSFDEGSGALHAEAGLSLSDLATSLLPRGWFSPVSPGTQYVTLGGMVASDIHGKNHHVHGTFGNFVREINLRVADGRTVAVSPTHEPDLFWATVGGMGLTGHILDVKVELERVPSPWIIEESERFDNLADVFTSLKTSSEDWPMTVSWIDTSARGPKAGRGIVIRGRWATADEAPRGTPPFRHGPTIPEVWPSGLLNPLTIRLANSIWFAKHGAKKRTRIASPHQFFWQLDMVREWNRVYGNRGFTQYQCVLPRDLSVYRDLLDRFQRWGGCSFVTVFKDCGPQGKGHLSFPTEGTSLALDIPIASIEKTRHLVTELNAFVLDHGGRIYLAKDAFTTADAFKRMYPRHTAFQAVRDQWDPDRRIVSAQSVRLLGDAPLGLR